MVKDKKKSKKDKKGKKPKLPDLTEVMNSFQIAQSILKCGLRSLRHRCDPSGDKEDAVPDLYDEVILFEKATEMFHATYEQLDTAEMAVYRYVQK